MERKWESLTDSSNEDIKWTTLDVRCATEVDELDIAVAIQDDVLVLNIAVYYFCLGMQVVDSLGSLYKDFPAFLLFHVDTELDVVEKIHARQAVRNHLDVVVDVVFEEIRHLDNVIVLEAVSS